MIFGGLAPKSVASLKDESPIQRTGAKITKVITKRKGVRRIVPNEGGFLPLIELHLFAAARS
jgi:hypothetical protein